MKNSIDATTYNAQVSSVSPQYGELEKGTVLEFDRVSNRSFKAADGNDVVSTSIVYTNATSRKKVRFSINMLEALKVEGSVTSSETIEGVDSIMLPTSINITDAKGTGIYSIRDYEGFQSAFDAVDKNWNDLTNEMREAIKATPAKGSAKEIQDYTATVSHAIVA